MTVQWQLNDQDFGAHEISEVMLLLAHAESPGGTRISRKELACPPQQGSTNFFICFLPV